MNRLGYRAVNVGERDLALGYQAFRERTDHAAFPLISTNIVRKDNGDPVFEPFRIVEAEVRGGRTVRIGVLGVARYNPVFLKAGPDGSSLVMRRPHEAVARYIDDVRAASDVVVLLAALHKEDAKAIVRQVEGIDVVIGSYGGIYTTRDEREGETLLVYSGNQGKRIGETRVFFDPDTAAVRSTTSYLYYLTAAYPGQPEWVDYVNGVLSKASAARTGQASTAAAHESR